MLPGLTRAQRAAKNASPALKFVLMVGIMSFFADFAYEGSRSITGPYLGLLGAGAFTISVIGVLINVSPGGLTAFCVITELTAIPLILAVRSRMNRTGTAHA